MRCSCIRPLTTPEPGKARALAVGHQLSGAVFPRVRLRTAGLGPALGSESEIITKLDAWNALIEIRPS